MVAGDGLQPRGDRLRGDSDSLHLRADRDEQDGRPEHDGDIAAQLALAVDSLEAVLDGAGMTLANLVRLNVYTTDVDALFPHHGILAGRLAAAGVAPTTTMLGVNRLAILGQIELEGTAVA